MADLNELKKAAGVRAANMIESGMTVGLGTGSTAAYMVERLGERIQTEGLKVTSEVCRKDLEQCQVSRNCAGYRNRAAEEK